MAFSSAAKAVATRFITNHPTLELIIETEGAYMSVRRRDRFGSNVPVAVINFDRRRIKKYKSISAFDYGQGVVPIYSPTLRDALEKLRYEVEHARFLDEKEDGTPAEKLQGKLLLRLPVRLRERS